MDHHVNVSTTYNLLYTCICTAALSLHSEPQEDYDVLLPANDYWDALNFPYSGTFKCCAKLTSKNSGHFECAVLRHTVSMKRQLHLHENTGRKKRAKKRGCINAGGNLSSGNCNLVAPFSRELCTLSTRADSAWLARWSCTCTSLCCGGGKVCRTCAS